MCFFNVGVIGLALGDGVTGDMFVLGDGVTGLSVSSHFH